MKKILLSLGIIGIVAIGAVGATLSFFSDTETSTGNTFTAGAIDLTVGSEQHYNGNICVEGQWQGKALYPTGTCDGSWVATDLGAETFFKFTDLKPGDSGENTITLNVENNDAWMCANFSTTGAENTIVEPEVKLSDTSEVGELGKYLEIMWWADKDGDNKLDSDETPLYGGPQTLDGWLAITGGSDSNGSLPLTISDKQVNALGDAVGTPIAPQTPIHFAVAWCLGDMDVAAGEGDGFTCDGSSVDNDSQTDGVVATLEFTVEQFRNNPDFLCAEHAPN